MKKVKHIFSSACMKVYNRKCAAVFSAAAIAFTSLTFTVHYSADVKAAEIQNNVIGSQKILELSESFLSFNADNNFSVLELTGTQTPENESVVFIEELSTGSESNREVTTEKATEKTTEAKTETTTKAPETTTKAVVTTEALTETSEIVSKPDGAYTFRELGLTQISDIPVPDDILFDENGIPLNYSRKLTGRSTAYCMGHTTATGTSVHEGVVAVDPRIIPYGSTMYIVANDGSIYGYSSAEDTGGFIYWNNAPLVDLYVNTTSFAYQWGNRGVTIYIF